MIAARPIELLAPAKNLDCGIEAIRHGADAVYIGAPKFSARAAAGNTIEDIQALCDYAHLFNVRIYVALNTILKDDELAQAEKLIHRLYAVGVDALIIQDMGITQLNLPPIPLHVSTQADNCSPGKVDFFYKAGFTQVVLARELTLEEIRAISRQTPVKLEAFVHGALCVSYSGKCYLSAAISGRSANRGECAQYCRLPYSLTDSDGKIIVHNKHLLSLKDLNRKSELESMMQAGVSSFKIEGRLKDISYVKNITAYYRKNLDLIFKHNPLYYRSSVGTSTYSFEPQPDKSFNRGFTPYFLHGRIPDIASFDSPKSIGEKVGAVKEIKGNSFTLAGLKPIHNGDGLVFVNHNGELEGFRVNRAETNRIYPLKMPSIRKKTVIYRNYDKIFEDQLTKPSAERKLSVDVNFSDTNFGFSLAVTDETGVRIIIVKPFNKERAKNNSVEYIKTQLSKLGNTPFLAKTINVEMSVQWFVPASLISEMRREAIDKLMRLRRIRFPRLVVKNRNYKANVDFPESKLEYTANVANKKANEFYASHGVKSIEPAFEICNRNDVPLMFTKHCLRYSMGWCPVHHRAHSPNKEPFYLVHKNIKLRLDFDCKNCRMLIFRD